MCFLFIIKVQKPSLNKNGATLKTDLRAAKEIIMFHVEDLLYSTNFENMVNSQVCSDSLDAQFVL